MNRNNTQFEITRIRFLFPAAIIANILPLSLCYFYKGGAPLLWTLFPPIHILLFLVNNKCSNTWPQVIILGLLHIAVTALTHLQCGWLYFHYIVDDSLGRMLSAGLCIIGTGIAITLSIISAIKFYRRQKTKS